jgi:hypothetical protein
MLVLARESGGVITAGASYAVPVQAAGSGEERIIAGM